MGYRREPSPFAYRGKAGAAAKDPGVNNAAMDKLTGGRRVYALPPGSNAPGGTRMPLGKFRGKRLDEIPAWYLRWAVVTLVRLRPYDRTAIARYLAWLDRPRPEPAPDPALRPPWEDAV